MSVKPEPKEASLGIKVLAQALNNATHNLLPKDFVLPAGHSVCAVLGKAEGNAAPGETCTFNLSAVNLADLQPSGVFTTTGNIYTETVWGGQASKIATPSVPLAADWVYYNPNVTVPYHYGDPPQNGMPYLGDPMPDSGGVYPNPLPNAGGTAWPMQPAYPLPFVPSHDPEQIKKLLDELNKLIKDKKITIGDPELQEAAKQELKHEPTEDEMDEIRRQIRDETLDGLFVERQF
jgi:hypothetical protein